MSAIEVKNLVKKFHGQTVLHGIDLEVKQNHFENQLNRQEREPK